MERKILIITDTAATIAVKSPHRASREGGLVTKSVTAAQNIITKILVYSL